MIAITLFRVVVLDSKVSFQQFYHCRRCCNRLAMNELGRKETPWASA
jgi:hypothetical protein